MCKNEFINANAGKSMRFAVIPQYVWFSDGRRRMIRVQQVVPSGARCAFFFRFGGDGQSLQEFNAVDDKGHSLSLS